MDKDLSSKMNDLSDGPLQKKGRWSFTEHKGDIFQISEFKSKLTSWKILARVFIKSKLLILKTGKYVILTLRLQTNLQILK